MGCPPLSAGSGGDAANVRTRECGSPRLTDTGQPIVPARIALGALLVKERLGLTDRETVETIQENPYMQFFLGMVFE